MELEACDPATICPKDGFGYESDTRYSVVMIPEESEYLFRLLVRKQYSLLKEARVRSSASLLQHLDLEQVDKEERGREARCFEAELFVTEGY